MVPSVLLLISLCVFAVHGQDDYAYYEGDYTGEIPGVDYLDDVDDWLYDYLDVSDECNPNPCLNGGSCDNTADGSFVCVCPEPYKGKKCQTVKNVCKNANCGNGDCLFTNTAPFFECKCKAPYMPPSCKKPAACRPDPCLNGGSCHKGKTRSSFHCDCPSQHRGKFCQVGPKDCFEDDGQSYRGAVSETEHGDDCLQWNSFFILNKGGANPFQEYEGFDGLGQHNHCRNPDGDAKPWCFVNKKGQLKWDYCNVRSCSGPAPPTRPTIHETEPTAEPAPAAFSQCGIPQPGRTSRIFGGKKSVPGAHPWQVSVQMRATHTEEPFSHQCGGILIESCWVLTAAHCNKAHHDFRVQLGGVDIEKDEEYDQTIDVEKFIVHEEYRETPIALYNDIALLKLKGVNGRCANETRFVKTACLPSKKFADNSECVISGWGATEKSRYGSNQLLDARVVLISQQRCSAPASYGDSLDNSMFCAGNIKGGVDSCQGDSGGPLVCMQNGTHYVSGVVSWGDGCGLKNKPGVYANVARFVDWIASKIL